MVYMRSVVRGAGRESTLAGDLIDNPPTVKLDYFVHDRHACRKTLRATRSTAIDRTQKRSRAALPLPRLTRPVEESSRKIAAAVRASFLREG